MDFDPKVKALNLASRHLGPVGASALAEALSSKEKVKLQKLLLRNNAIGNSGATALVKSLFFGDNDAIYLLELDLSTNRIQGSGVSMLGLALEQPSTVLKKLFLGGNTIAFSGFEVICKALCVNTTLESLTVCDCGIGPVDKQEGIPSHVGKALYHNSTLKVLDLSRNQIDCHMAMSTFLWALAKRDSHCALKVLNLNQNSIGSDGAARLGQVFRVNKTLKTVYLSSNPIGVQGVVAISQGLVHNQVLQHLEMYGIAIEKEGAVALRDSLVRCNNRAMKCLLVDSNPVYQIEEQQIDLYCDLNKAGRKYTSNVKLPWSLWPLILERVSHRSDLLFCFLREKPDVVKR